MKKQNSKKDEKKMTTGTAIAIGAGVLALAAGSYYFFGPEGKQNRGKLKGWMIKMKGEIVEKMEDAKDLTEAVYTKIVDTVAAKYAKGSKIAETDIRAFADSLKRQWKGITKHAAPKKAAKKSAPKKAAKKSGNK